MRHPPTLAPVAVQAAWLIGAFLVLVWAGRRGRSPSAVRVWSERGGLANLTDVAAAAGVSRATLYRYSPNREALLEALADHALADSASRVVAAGLDRAPVDVAIEPIVRGFASVADHYAVLTAERVELDLDEKNA
jgi:TetR/AcrR family transcriptional regulator, mexCD-oprJ operon repressor